MRFLQLTFFLFLAHFSHAQNLVVSCAFENVRSDQLDELVYNYNFSRTFLKVQQPFLRNGLSVTFSSINNTAKKIQKGFQISYSRIGSSVVNDGFTNTFAMHLLKPGYIIRCGFPAKMNRLYADVCMSGTFYTLVRSQNKVPNRYYDRHSVAIGAGAEIGLRISYSLNTNRHYLISPFIGTAYVPYIFSPRNEVIINQTKGLFDNKYISMLSMQLGFSVMLNR